MFLRTALLLILAGVASFCQVTPARSADSVAAAAASSTQDPTDAVKAAQLKEQTRTDCINGRRYICGRVLQVATNGLVVDSGYSRLLSPPFNKSWVVRSNVSVDRDPHAVEEKKPDAICVGIVFLSNSPKRPTVKEYDYVVIHGYPAKTHLYVPVPGVEKTIRRYSASLERAVEINLASESK